MEAGLFGDSFVSERVVGIDADEDVIVAVLNGVEVVDQHGGDDVALAPEGDEDGDAALGRAGEMGGVGEEEAPAGDPGDQGDEEIVETADQDPDSEGDEARSDPAVGGV